jgi:transposase
MKPLIEATRQVLIGDRGYRGKRQEKEIRAAGYEYRAPPSDRNDPYAILDKPLSKSERGARARVEHCHAWMQNFRSLLVRYSRKTEAFEAAIDVACLLIWWRRMASNGIQDRTEGEVAA